MRPLSNLKKYAKQVKYSAGPSRRPTEVVISGSRLARGFHLPPFSLLHCIFSSLVGSSPPCSCPPAHIFSISLISVFLFQPREWKEQRLEHQSLGKAFGMNPQAPGGLGQPWCHPRFCSLSIVFLKMKEAILKQF